jgi:hypothetical protein
VEFSTFTESRTIPDATDTLIVFCTAKYVMSFWQTVLDGIETRPDFGAAACV